MRIVSMDTSTNKSGVATFDNGELVDYRLIDCSKNKDVELRINEMGGKLLDYLIEQRPEAIYIEHPQGKGSNVAMVGKLCEILGIVRSYAIRKHIHYEEFPPSVWRKYAKIQQGKKTRDELKRMSMDYVMEHYGIEVNDDVSDAITLGCAVFNYYNSIS